MNTITWIDHLYVTSLCIMFLIAVTTVQPGIKGEKFSTADKIATYWGQSLFLYFVAGVGVLIWFLRDRSFVDLGIAWPTQENQALYLSLGGLFLVLYGGDLIANLFPASHRKEAARRWKQRTPFMPENRFEMMHGLHLAFCAGLTEEVVFRGYLINYFVRLFDGQALSVIARPIENWNVTLAILIPSAIFGLSHLYLGWSDVFKIIVLSVIFGFIFVLSGSLLQVVLLHILIDVIANLISPWLMSQQDADAASALNEAD